MNQEGTARLFARGAMPDGPFPEHYEPMDAYIANPLHPKVSSNPVVRVFAADAKSFGTPDKFPIVATSYRLAEHFHYWTKNVHDNAVLQPEMFVEMGERLAKAKGIQNGDWVEISSQRGAIKAKACVTKRIRPHHGRRQAVRRGRAADPLRLHRRHPEVAAGQHADAVGRRRQRQHAGVQGVPGRREENHATGAVAGGGLTGRVNMSILQSLDIRRRSASTVAPPPADKPAAVEVAKLIDVSKCIGCKACQAACLEWNDLEQPIGYTDGTYNNPTDLTPAAWTVMRFTEYEHGDDLEWLIRKDGCMHCDDPGCLKACPAPGAIVQYTNGIVDFVSENCIGCGYCVKGCPFNIPRISKVDRKAYKCTLCSDRVVVGQAPACAKACPTQAIFFGTKADMIGACRQAHRRPEVARLSERRPLQSAGRRRHACHVRAAPCRQAVALRRPARQSAYQPDGRPVEGHAEADLAGRHRLRRRVRPAALRHQGPQPGHRERRAQGGELDGDGSGHEHEAKPRQPLHHGAPASITGSRRCR